MARKKGPAPAATMWEQAEEVPRAGIPDTDKLMRRMKMYRRVIWAVIVTFPVVGLGFFVAASSLKAAAEEQPVVVEVDADARAVAMTAVDAWLAGEPAPLPGGTLVSWDEMAALPAFVPGPGDAESTVANAPDLQEHTLTVRDSAGMRYRVQVLVAKSKLGELSVVGSPSLLPVPLSSEWAAGVSPWPNYDPTTAGESVETAVSAWAEAFASGDPGKLRLIVGDSDANHAYQPMVGVVSAEVETVASSWLTDDDGEPTSQMLVQVQLRFRWPDADPRREAPAAATYDLLVDGADSAAPRVVAWGGSGTGPVLRAYQNAVVGLELEAAQAPTGTTATQAPATGADGTTTTGTAGLPADQGAVAPDTGETAPDETGN